MTFVNITASVGMNGHNKVEDVFPMQILLNKFIIPGCLNPTKVLTVDGIVGNKTIAAIRDFQRRICGFSKPDGRIDPGGKTLNALNGPLVSAKASPADTTREWAISLGEISSGLVEFMLVNRASGVVRKLAVRSPGILPAFINKTFADRWVTFQTSLALEFDDFNTVLASFSKADAAQRKYKMTFGWLGSVPVTPVPAKSLSQACSVVTPSMHGTPAFSTILGCDVGLGSGKLGVIEIDSRFSQQLKLPELTPPGPVPMSYPGAGLWSPLHKYTEVLLAP